MSNETYILSKDFFREATNQDVGKILHLIFEPSQGQLGKTITKVEEDFSQRKLCELGDFFEVTGISEGRAFIREATSINRIISLLKG